MKEKNKSNTHEKLSLAILLLGLAGIASVLTVDQLYLREGLLAEGWPNLGYGYVLRSALILASVSLILRYFIIRGKRGPGVGSNSVGAGIGRFEELCIGATLCTSLVFVLLFLTEPAAFSYTSREDGPVEWASFGFLLAASVVFLIAFLRCRGRTRVSKLTQWTLAMFALVFFVIGMEEVSWLQRVVDVETPGMLRGNKQKEINFHNVVTNPIENAYYFGAFVLLIILPFVRSLSFFPKDNKYFEAFIPRPFIIFIGAIACAYNFDMWDIIFTQFAFFSVVVILVSFIARNPYHRFRTLSIEVLLSVVLTQVVFLSYGENYSRLWEVTEYKELFIPLGFLVYAIDTYLSVARTYLEPVGGRTPTPAADANVR
jgi:hypothetical protein